MANKISDETIEYVGILAKLELSEEEKLAARSDMERMLDYIDTLNELDTEGIEPMSHVFPVNNVFREDVVTNGDGSRYFEECTTSEGTVLQSAKDHWIDRVRRIRDEYQKSDSSSAG